VLVEVDSGEHRSGSSPDAAGEVARAARDSGSEVVGVFTHGGHSYATLGTAEAAADDEVDALRRAMDSLQAAGIEPEVVSAGSTPTAALSARPPVTEERPGTYVVGDRQQVMLGACDRQDVALFVVATVVSRDVLRGTVTLNSGAKSLARDRKPWMTGHGELIGYPEASIEELYDYHAVVSVNGGVAPELGEQVLVMPNHACPVVNLAEEFHMVRSGRVVDTWRVDARGRSA
jgi:D-serine deaminase-like pyridoxal phosphate-dependent protein